MRPRLRMGAALALGCAAFAGCGGGSGPAPEPDPGGPTTFRAYVASRPASAPAAVTPAEAGEAATLSRHWAAAAVASAPFSTSPNVMTAPALYFGRLQAVAAAAQGDTLGALARQVSLPTSPGSWAALLRGLSRGIGAAPDAVITGRFMQAMTLVGYELHWAELNLYEVSAANLALEPTCASRPAAPGPAAGPGRRQRPFAPPTPSPMAAASSSTWCGCRAPCSPATRRPIAPRCCRCPTRARLVQVTPRGAIGTWTAADVSQALLEVSQAP